MDHTALHDERQMEEGSMRHESAAPMMRRHYAMLVLNLIVSAAIMYLMMFTMIARLGDFFNNLNMFYMALTMAAPMGVVMLLTMRGMYANRRLNALLHAVFMLLFIGALAGVRSQGFVGDRQFIRSMIPHHSGAILMCNRSSTKDAEIRELCFRPNGIVESQQREIEQMNAILGRL